ncbi:hypothetical protein OHU34_42675 [Streptomyces sp. NBC_00080]|uniref:hypothetical protein n=1 Tax=Streptomyces sp. NBC_00080 TaxID=2975645 RepID=UPI0032522433
MEAQAYPAQRDARGDAASLSVAKDWEACCASQAAVGVDDTVPVTDGQEVASAVAAAAVCVAAKLCPPVTAVSPTSKLAASTSAADNLVSGPRREKLDMIITQPW